MNLDLEKQLGLTDLYCGRIGWFFVPRGKILVLVFRKHYC